MLKKKYTGYYLIQTIVCAMALAGCTAVSTDTKAVSTTTTSNTQYSEMRTTTTSKSKTRKVTTTTTSTKSKTSETVTQTTTVTYPFAIAKNPTVSAVSVSCLKVEWESDSKRSYSVLATTQAPYAENYVITNRLNVVAYYRHLICEKTKENKNYGNQSQ